jgi:hypothetical protein
MMPATFRSAMRGRLISQVMLSRLVGAWGAWPSSSACRGVVVAWRGSKAHQKESSRAQWIVVRSSPPRQSHASRGNAFQRALQAPDGAIDPPRFPHGPQHA